MWDASDRPDFQGAIALLRSGEADGLIVANWHKGKSDRFE